MKISFWNSRNNVKVQITDVLQLKFRFAVFPKQWITFNPMQYVVLKRKTENVVDFGDTLAEILKTAKKEQHKQRFLYGQLYHRNYYKEVREKNRVHYEYYNLDGTQEVPMDYTEIFCQTGHSQRMRRSCWGISMLVPQ